MKSNSRPYYMLSIYVLLLALSVPAYSADEYGYFDGDGEVKAAWVVEPDERDRNVRLLEPFTYVDPSDRRWTAPAGAVVDGASIPPALWNVWIGTPFVGNYRRASVVHDYECEVKTAESSHLVHRMFYVSIPAQTALIARLVDYCVILKKVLNDRFCQFCTSLQNLRKAKENIAEVFHESKNVCYGESRHFKAS